MAGIISPLDPSFVAFRHERLANPHTTNRAFSLIGGQLCIVDRMGDNSFEGETDLRKISSFVREMMGDEELFGQAISSLDSTSLGVCLVNLGWIASRIEVHNQRVNGSSLIAFLHALLLVITLGIFRLRSSLRAEELSLTVNDKVIGQLFQLISLLNLGLSLGTDDFRSAILDVVVALERVAVPDSAEGRAYVAEREALKKRALSP